MLSERTAPFAQAEIVVPKLSVTECVSPGVATCAKNRVTAVRVVWNTRLTVVAAVEDAECTAALLCTTGGGR